MSIKIALAGNPNSGKTTMFNDLTGSSQYVGNWPGVTVEKKEGILKDNRDVVIQDLPGIYSLSPYTLEEVVSRNYLINDKPDAIINIIDGTNLERNLYLTTQLLELGLPTVIALNMMDVVRKSGDKIDVSGLSKALGCPIYEASALKGEGSREAALAAASLSQKGAQHTSGAIFEKKVEDCISKIENIIDGTVDPRLLRWFAIKLFERDEKVLAQLSLSADSLADCEEIIKGCETALDDDSESIVTNQRYIYISGLVKKYLVKKNTKGLSASDKIDRIVTNRILALPIFALVMFAVYYFSISTVGDMLTGWVNDVLFGELIGPSSEAFLVGIGCADWLTGLIVEGIIGGVGAVLGFLPQMLCLFFCLALLEDCGYMARIAFIMDRIFRRFGLSGKSFIPMLVATGCGVPGVMASRTIENESDRKMTIITTTFMPCGAKLPVIALIAGAFFSESPWVAPLSYFIGIGAIIFSGIVLKKTKGFAGNPAPFVMELPAYHMPAPKSVLIHMWDRGFSFVKKAGSIILLSCVAIWFLGAFSWSFEMVENSGDSILASLGNMMAPLFAPLGWGSWQGAVAAISGLIAKENVVGTFGVLFGAAEVAEDGIEIWSNLGGMFTAFGGFSFLVFNLLCAPCFAAIGAIHREMGNAKWTWIAIGYQTGLAYCAALVFYQLAVFFAGGGFGLWTGVAIALVIYAVYMLVRPAKKAPAKSVSIPAAHARV